MPPKKYTKEDFVQNRKDVQDLSAAVDNLTKKQEGFFAALTTSGDKFKEIVDTSKALSKSLSESTKRTEENNDLAENQSKIAKLGISLGKRQTIFSKYILAYKLKQLKATRAQQDFEDDITDDMIDQIDAQREQVDLAGALNKETDALDSLFGNVGSTIRDFVTNPLVGIIGMLAMFSTMTDKIGEKFGALGVTKFRDDLAASNIEFIKMGLEGEEAFTAAEQLANNFGIGFDNAIAMSKAVGDLAKSTGTTVEHSATLMGLFSDGTEESAETSMNLIKSAESLAVANDVAPSAVLEDVANNTELFAKYAKDGGENILRAAIQAKKLGISLDTIANTASGLLDFQTSLNNEIEASIMLGRDVNLQKARELSLSGDLEGLQKEILNIVGDEAEYNNMNVLQRESLAKALNMSVFDLNKMVRKEKEQVSLAGELAKQDLSKLIPDETMSKIAETINKLKAFGLTLIEEYGPKIEGMFTRLVEPMMGMAKSAANFLISLDESVGIGNVLKGILAFLAVKSVVVGVANIISSFAKIPMGVGIPLGIAAVYGFYSLLSEAEQYGDVISPAKGKTMMSTKEGDLIELSKNDDVIAAPGLADKLNGGQKNAIESEFTVGNLMNPGLLPFPLSAASANDFIDKFGNKQKFMMGENEASVTKPKLVGDLVYSPNEGGLGLTTPDDKFTNPIVNVDTPKQKIEVSTDALERENKAIKNELTSLRKEMASYFGFGGSAINAIGSKVGDRVADAQFTTG